MSEWEPHSFLELSDPSLRSKGLQLKGLQEVLGVGGGICTSCTFFCQTTVHIIAKSLLTSGGAGQAQLTAVQRDSRPTEPPGCHQAVLKGLPGEPEERRRLL